MRDEFDQFSILTEEDFVELSTQIEAYRIKEIIELDEQYLVQIEANNKDTTEITRDLTDSEKISI